MLHMDVMSYSSLGDDDKEIVLIASLSCTDIDDDDEFECSLQLF